MRNQWTSLVLTHSVANMQEELTKLNSRVTDLDMKLDDALNEIAEATALRVQEHFNPMFQDMRRDIDNALVKHIQLEQDVNEHLEFLERDMRAIKIKLSREPFDLNRSVIMLGVAWKQHEDLELVVEDIMVGALGVDVNVIAVDRASPRNN